MSIDMLKMLIESACSEGTVSDQDRALLKKKARELNISDNELENLINSQLSESKSKGENISSGFITNQESTKTEDVSSGFITSGPGDDSTQFIQKETPQIKSAETLKISAKIEKPSSLFTDVTVLDSQGAMSLIQKGKLHGKWIIIKRIKPEFKNDPKYKELFYKEFENAYMLDHPNIVRLLDKGEDDEGSYYTMELIDGRPLTKMILPGGIKDKKLVKRVFSQMLDALSYVHKKQIYHRDLKPDNILVTFKGDNVKILDFGLAAADSYEDDLVKVGTPKYAAPEQKTRGNTVDQRADIYSLGLIFLEMLTGDLNDRSCTKVENANYKYVIEKCLKESADERFDDCLDILEWVNKPEVLVEKPKEEMKKEEKPEIKTEPAKEDVKQELPKVEEKQVVPPVVKKEEQKDEKQEKLNQLKREADEAFNKKDFLKAKSLYTQYLALAPDEKYIKEQIDKCNKLLAPKQEIQQTTEIKKKSPVVPILIVLGVIVILVVAGYFLKDKIFKPGGSNSNQNTELSESEKIDKYKIYKEKADNLLQKQDYNNSKSNYDSALIYKPGDPDATSLKKKVEKIIEYRNEADGLFKDKNIARAVLYYDSLKQMVPEDKLAKDQLPNCKQIIEKATVLKMVSEASTNRCGFADNQGYIVIDYLFSEATAFNNGLAAVKNTDNKWGLIDLDFRLNKKQVVDFKYDRIRREGPGYMATINGDPHSFAFFMQNGQLVSRVF